VAGIAANVVYLANDPTWLKSLGDLITTGIGHFLSQIIATLWPILPMRILQSGLHKSPMHDLAQGSGERQATGGNRAVLGARRNLSSIAAFLMTSS
jgi:hypothetical protein